MLAELVTEQLITVGQPVVIEAESPSAAYFVVFEDDGETGYFYALDLANAKQRIVDAVHIYDVAADADRDKASLVRIGWSKDGCKAILTINCYPHAVFNFETRSGYCRTGFPPANGAWSVGGHEWDDHALDFFE